MKTVGIIAEYNPFHNGHAYQIQQAKALSGADCAVIVMSGNFTQRGAPALIHKFDRTAMALNSGADFVFELPTIWAVSSAESFAAASIALLNALGCVDTLCFGCETPNLSLISDIAQILIEEPQEYTNRLLHFLKEGQNYPAARANSAASYLLEQNSSIKKAELTSIFSSPNNILALEYLKALKKQNSNIKPLPILRVGSGYHDTNLGQQFCSASALRSCLLQKPSDKNRILDYIPPKTAEFLLTTNTHYVTEQDFSQMLYYKLLSEKSTGFSDYIDGSTELSNKIINSLSNFCSYKNFCEHLKSKEITYTRISRLLLHILLNLKKTDEKAGKEIGYIPYLRLLGFKKESSGLLHKINKKTSLPILARTAKDAAPLTGTASKMFHQDVFASDLYYGILAQKSQTAQKNEFQRKLITI